MYRVRLKMFGVETTSDPVSLEQAISIMKANFASMSGEGQIIIIKE